MTEKESSRTDKHLETKSLEQIEEILKNLPAKELNLILARKYYSGPLPPPETLKAYNDTIPGIGERIIIAFEKQRDHRIELETHMLNKNFETARRGQYMGFFISIVGLTVSGVIAVYSSALAASLIGVASLTSLVKLFLVDPLLSKQKNKTRDEKNSP